MSGSERETVESITSYRVNILEAVRSLEKATAVEVAWELRKIHMFASCEMDIYLSQLMAEGVLALDAETGKYSIV